jgi:non-specific serine/threonine protein kinase
MGNIVYQAGDPSGAMRSYLESITLFEEAGDRWSALEPLGRLVNIYSETGDLEPMHKYRNRFMAIYNELKGRYFYGKFVWHLGLMSYALQDFAQMEADFLLNLEDDQKIDNQWSKTWSLRMLAIATKRQGQPVKAAGYCLQSLNQSVEMDDPAGVRTAISLMAGFVAEEQPQRAARLLGAAQALFEAFQKPMDRYEAMEFERDAATARAQLSEAVFQPAWEEGRAMTLEQAIQEARAIGAEITVPNGESWKSIHS